MLRINTSLYPSRQDVHTWRIFRRTRACARRRKTNMRFEWFSITMCWDSKARETFAWERERERESECAQDFVKSESRNEEWVAGSRRAWEFSEFRSSRWWDFKNEKMLLNYIVDDKPKQHKNEVSFIIFSFESRILFANIRFKPKFLKEVNRINYIKKRMSNSWFNK